MAVTAVQALHLQLLVHLLLAQVVAEVELTVLVLVALA
jgi:hypothetical protein